MSISEKYLEASYKKAISPVISEERESIEKYVEYIYQKGFSEGSKSEIISQGLFTFVVSLAIFTSFFGSFGFLYWKSTRFPATECNYDYYCPMPSKANWVPQADQTLTYEFKDGTVCWKREGSGSAVCLLP